MLDSDDWHHLDDDDGFHWMSRLETYGNRLVWEQYTGFKDKDGKEVSENDIILYPPSMMYGEVYLHVRFLEAEGRWALCNDAYSIMWDLCGDEDDPVEFTIKGNIHLNADLLKTPIGRSQGFA